MSTPRSFLLTLLLAPALLLASDQSVLLLQATDAYAKGEYEQALALYDSVNTSATGPALLYNIGNCHMKLGDVPHAILFYERALRLQPGAEDIQANLDFARTQVVDRVNQLPGLSLGSLWDRLRGGKDVDQWARRSLWACLLLFVLAGATYTVRGRSMRRVLLALTAIMLLLTVTASALAYYRVAEVNDRSEAIIMAPKVDVRGEPRMASTTLFVLHEGTKVNVLQEENGWYEVKLGNGSVGWAPPSALVII